MTEPTGNYQQPNYPNQPQPPAYSAATSAHQGQYNQQGAYAGYAQAYGQGLPAHMDEPTKPQKLKTATAIIYTMIGLALASSLLGAFFMRDIQASMTDSILSLFSGVFSEAEQQELRNEIAMQEELAASGLSLILGMVWSLIWTGLLITATVFMSKGQNWARIALTIYAAFNIFGLLSLLVFFLVFHWIMLIEPINAVLAIVFLVLVWSRPVSQYMQQVRIFKQWKLQRAYMGADEGQQNQQGYQG